VSNSTIYNRSEKIGGITVSRALKGDQMSEPLPRKKGTFSHCSLHSLSLSYCPASSRGKSRDWISDPRFYNI
jgi:hypothetical protein